MSTWNVVAQDPAETEAFFSLLDQYFASRPTAGTSTPPPASQPQRRTLPPASTAPLPPRSLPTSIPTTSLSSRADSHLSSLTHAAGPSIANAALKNTSVTSAALRNAGLSPGAAAAASRFGSTHSTVLAPHLANAAEKGWANRAGAGVGGESGEAGRKPLVKPKGPQPLAGLSSSKTIAGGFETSNGKDFGKSLWSSKGPMSSEEARKNVFKESLATKPPPRTYAPSTTAHSPPPLRGPPLERDEIGRAQAIYDYAGTEADDLMVQEGEVLGVLEHVSEDWWKCRGAQGEGLVPVSYLQGL